MNNSDKNTTIQKLEAEIAALKVRNQWLSMAITECPEAIVITDIKGMIEYVNPSFTSITGYTEEEVVGKNTSILKSGIHSDLLYADLWSTVLAGYRWEGEICNKRKDNTLYWEKNSIAPVKNEQGEITHFVSTKVDITHLKAKESSQMEVLFWQRKILETLPAGIAIETNGHIVWINKTFSVITGIPETNVLNQPIASFFHYLDNDIKISKKAQQAISKGETFNIDLKLREVDSKNSWYNLKAQKFSYSNGKQEIVWLFQDISQQKIAENKLRESEELFRNAFSSNASIMLVVSYPDGKIQEVNPSFEKRTGYKQDEVVGRTSEIIHLWKNKTREKIFELLSENECVNDLDTYYFTKEGTRRNCLVNIAIIKTHSDNSAFVTITDTTTSNQALRSLKENEERFRFMAEGISDIISLHSPTAEATIQYISPAIEQIQGISSSQLIGHSPLEFIDEEDVMTGFHDPLLRILRKESSREIMEYKLIFRNQETWLETSIKPMLDSEGEIIRLVAVSREITHRKKIEQQLRDVSVMKDKFLSIIAHDLKNPFNTLLGFSSLLKENADRYTIERIKEFAGDIYHAALGGVNLLDELLQWALFQSGRITATPDTYNLSENSKDVFELANIQAAAKHVLLINNIPTDLMVYADKRMDSTVLRNLISNAIKFTSNGGIVRVSAKNSYNLVEVTVTDTGVGLQAEDIPKLFRIDIKPSEIGTTTENKGTGLGLILCQEFVKKNGGTISAKSVFGQGSEFSYTIPVPTPLK